MPSKPAKRTFAEFSGQAEAAVEEETVQQASTSRGGQNNNRGRGHDRGRRPYRPYRGKGRPFDRRGHMRDANERNQRAGPQQTADPPLANIFKVDGTSQGQTTSWYEFYPDFSGFPDIINSTHRALVTVDKDFGRFVSLAIYQYYCYTALWCRYLLYSKASNAPTLDTEEILGLLGPSDFPIPSPIAGYLASIGEFISPGHLSFRPRPAASLIVEAGLTAAGHFGTPGHGNHFVYMHLPAPFVYVRRMIQELSHNVTGSTQWALPAPLASTQGGFPTPNLLGYEDYTGTTTYHRQEALPFFTTAPDGTITALNGTRTRFQIQIELLCKIKDRIRFLDKRYKIEPEIPNSKCGSIAQLGWVEWAQDFHSAPTWDHITSNVFGLTDLMTRCRVRVTETEIQNTLLMMLRTRKSGEVDTVVGDLAYTRFPWCIYYFNEFTEVPENWRATADAWFTARQGPLLNVEAVQTGWVSTRVTTLESIAIGQKKD